MGTGSGEPTGRDRGALVGTIAGRVLKQALLDVCSQSQSERLSALMYFTQYGHEGFCIDAEIDAEELFGKVINACRWNEGGERKEAIKKILKDLEVY